MNRAGPAPSPNSSKGRMNKLQVERGQVERGRNTYAVFRRAARGVLAASLTSAAVPSASLATVAVASTLLLAAGRAYAIDPFVVSDIRIEGIQRIEAGTVFSYLPIKVGDRIDDNRAQEAVRALFGTGFFRDVRLEVQGTVLIVQVEERPAVASIDFVGLKEFPLDQLRKALRESGLAEGRTFDRAVLDQAEQEIKRQYLTRGKYGATVTTTVTPLERNRVAVNFAIDEGEVARIARINIVGNTAFSESTLLDQFVLQTPGWMTWYTKNDRYSRQKLAGDIESVRSYYQNRGYLDFTVDSTQVSITPDKEEIYITVNVTEGERYTVSDFKLGGDLIAPEEELRKLITVKPGDAFSRQRLTESTKAIAERLGNDGYAFANANAVPEIDKEKRTVAFTVMVDPGRRVYVRRINIVGNSRTRDEVIRRELRQLEGAYYDNLKLQRSKRRLDLTQFFSEVDMETDPVAGTTDQVDVTVRVKERATGNLLLGVGFSSADRIVLTGSISQQNLFGTGNSLSLQVNSGSINKVYALSYNNPYYTVDGISRGFDLYDRRFDPTRLSLGNYRTDTRGAGVRFGYPLSELDRLNFGLAAEQTNIRINRDGDQKSPQRFIDYVDRFGEKTNAVIGTVGWARDGRDSSLWPTTGAVQRIFAEGGLPGMDLKYWKLGYSNTYYVPISTRLTWSLGGELGWGDGYGGQPLPFFKSYYAGGVSSIRGYQQSSLGPRDANGVLGGTRKATGSTEFLFPFPGLGQDRTVRLGVFFDGGQVWSPGIPGASLKELGIRYSSGLSFSWISPIGPLRLSFGQPLNFRDGDRSQRFQFLLGNIF
jgi:outer membrane protein insertion porin family